MYDISPKFLIRSFDECFTGCGSGMIICIFNRYRQLFIKLGTSIRSINASDTTLYVHKYLLNILWSFHTVCDQPASRCVEMVRGRREAQRYYYAVSKEMTIIFKILGKIHLKFSNVLNVLGTRTYIIFAKMCEIQF